QREDPPAVLAPDDFEGPARVLDCRSHELPSAEQEEGLPELDPVAVAERPAAVDRLAIDPGPSARGEAPEDELAAIDHDLGVPACDGRVAEESDLGALVESQGRGLAG